MGILELLLEFGGLVIFDLIGTFIVMPFINVMKGIGAVIFSCFSLFRKSPSQHYHTESFDKEVGMFWTGFVFVVLVSVLIFKYI